MTASHRVFAPLWAAALIFIAAVAATATLLLARAERDAMTQASRQVRQLTALAVADVNRTLLSADLKLSGLPALLPPASDTAAAGDDAWRRRSSDALAAAVERQLTFSDLELFAADGERLAGALAVPASRHAPLAASLREAVRRAGPGKLVMDGAAQQTGRSGSAEPSVLMMRALATPHGPVIAVGSVPAELLGTAMAGNAGDVRASITLERADGRMLATSRPSALAPGSELVRLLGRAPLGTEPAHAPARPGGEAALVLSQPTLYPDLLVSVSLPLAQALAASRAERGTVIAAAAAFAVFTLLAAALGHVQLLRLAGARRAATRSAQTLQQALAAMADGFLLCDAEDRVAVWNDRYLDLFPWLRGFIEPGMPFRRLAERAAQHALVDATAEAQQTWIEMRLSLHSAADREWEQVLSSGVAVHAVERRMPDGGVVSVYRDISTAERALRRAKADAEAANEAKSQFLANMSHEIRTPLNGVLGLNELLLGSPLNAKQRHWAEVIRDSGRLLLTLINDILDLSRIESGQLELHPTVFDAAALAHEIEDLLQPRAAAKGLAFEVVLLHPCDGRDGGPPHPPPPLFGDAMRLRQVLLNLVGNAIKFTEHGAVSVRLTLEPAGGDAVALSLSVRDTGIGIAPQALATLFDRFTQADSGIARRFGGSGLGLAISREIARRMGGDIEVDSHPQRGSEFRARLLLARADGAPTAPCPAEAATPLVADSAAAGGGLHILVAEDNEVNRLLIDTVLRHMGHRPHLVDNGCEALAALRQHAFDVVLMDMQMPQMDGLAATRALRALPGKASRVPVVAMTANAREEDRRACLEAGMDEFVAKPLDLVLLRAMLERVPAIARRRAAAAAPLAAAAVTADGDAALATA